MRWYSSGFSPCAATSASVISGSRRRRVSDIGAPVVWLARLYGPERSERKAPPRAGGAANRYAEKKGRALARPKSNREVEADRPEGVPNFEL